MINCTDKLEQELEDLLFELQVEVIYPGNTKLINASIILLEQKLPKLQLLIDNIKVELAKHNE